jgi:hypothetical protein
MTTFSSIDNTVTTPSETESNKGLTLSELLAESLRVKKEAVNYPQPNKANFSQRPNRPPHGTRRAMGKR